MSMRLHYAWLLLLLSTLSGCADSTTPGAVGGETHFLQGCDDQSSCGLGLDCVCGVCTRPCVTDNSCKDESSLATCEPAGTPSGACDNPLTSPVCDVKCTLDADCTTLGDTYTCESGSCRKLEAGSCVRDGVFYTNCSNGGMDSGRDSGIDSGDVVVPEPACNTTDSDGGTPNLETVPPRTLTCPAATAAMALPGATVVGSSSDVVALALGQDDVYWASYGPPYLLQASKLGSATLGAIGLSSSSDSTAGLVYSGCRLYWGSDRFPSDISIGSWTVDGNDIRTLSHEPYTNVYSLLVDQSHVYFTTSSASNDVPSIPSGMLLRVPRGGGATTVIAEGVNGTFLSLIDSPTHVFWITLDEDRTTALDEVHEYSKEVQYLTGPTLTNLANPVSILKRDQYLYVSNAGTWDSLGNHRGDGSIVRMESSTGGTTTLATGLTTLPTGFTGALSADDTYLYWLAGTPTAAKLMRLPRDGSAPPSVVFDNLQSERGILAMDDTHFYWPVSCASEGAFVVRVPKGQN